MPTRREFIKQSTLLAAGAMLSNKAFALNFIKKPKVIILGAGLSGLAAAKILFEHGFEVEILEARNRISGRVYSYVIDEKENLIIELGGEWIGDSHLRLQALCKELNLELSDNRFHDRLIYDNKFYTPDDDPYLPDWYYSP